MTLQSGQDEFGAVCPYLGLADDADSHATYATEAHRCYRLPNPTRIATGHRRRTALGQTTSVARCTWAKVCRALPPLPREQRWPRECPRHVQRLRSATPRAAARHQRNLVPPDPRGTSDRNDGRGTPALSGRGRAPAA